MKPYYDCNTTPGYLQSVQDIQKYASLVASLLGHDPGDKSEEERVRLYHQLLEEHPYAYPLALELSLYLPPATAIAWLRTLWKNYYAFDVKNAKNHALREIEAFLVWRMTPQEAVEAVVAHIATDGYVLPGVEMYLAEQRPMLYAYFQKRRSKRYVRGCDLWSRWDGIVRLATKAFRKALTIRKPDMQMPHRLWVWYLRGDTPQAHAIQPFFRKCIVWIAMRMLARNIVSPNTILCKPRWMNLPSLRETRTQQNNQQSETAYRFNICTIAWGEEYVRMFLEYNLPSLLAPGNLPALAQAGEVDFCIYTERDHLETIRQSPCYALLRRYATVRFFFVDRILDEVAYAFFVDAGKALPMIIMFNHFWKMTTAEGKYAVSNFPDGIIQSDLYTYLLSMLKKGKTLVYLHPCGLHTVKEQIEKSIKSYVNNDIIEISNAQIHDLVDMYRHPSATVLLTNATQRYFAPSMVIHRAGDEGLIVNMTCMQPYLAKPDISIPCIEATYDHFVIITPLSSWVDIHICRNTRQACVLSMEPLRGQDNVMRFGNFNEKQFAMGIRQTMGLFNRIFFSLPIFSPRNEINNKEIWRQSEEKSERYTRKVLQYSPEKIFMSPIAYFFTDDIFLDKLFPEDRNAAQSAGTSA